MREETGRVNTSRDRVCVYRKGLSLLRRTTRVLLSVCLLFGSTFGQASDKISSEPETELMRELDALRQAHNVAALGLVIVKDDRIKLLEVRGLASRAPSVAIEADAIFRIGSISKMFAGLTAAKLEASGIIALDTPIHSPATQDTYSNQWQANHPITIAQLLEHTAGLEGISQAEWDFSDPAQPPLQKTLHLFPGARQTQWPPGLHHSYSNAGAGLAGYVMENATGETWEELLSKEVFEPLGMSDTTVFKPSQQRSPSGYDKDGSTLIPYWYQIFRPFAAINSSLQDMGLFLRMLIDRGQLDNKPIFPAAVIDRIEAPTTGLAARKGLAYGYGLGNYQWLRDGVLFHGHGGDADGYLSKLGYTRRNNSGYFLVITAFQSSTLVEMQKRVEKYLIENLEAISAPTELVLSSKETEQISGLYQRLTRRFPQAEKLSTSPSMQIYSKGGQLFSQGFGGRSKRLVPVTTELFRRSGEDRATLFIGRGEDEQIYFQEGSDNFRKITAPALLKQPDPESARPPR